VEVEELLHGLRAIVLDALRFLVLRVRQLQDMRLHGSPPIADRLDDGRLDETLDVLARRVLGAESVTFVGVERADEERAEDRGLDVAPVELGRIYKKRDVLRLEREGVDGAEEVTVETAHKV